MSLSFVKRKVSFDDFAKMCAFSKEANDFVKLLFAQFESFLDCFYKYYLKE